MKPSSYSQVVSLIAQARQIEPASIHPHDHLIEDLGFDALELAELVALLQQEFRTRAQHVCQPGCLTVTQIVNAIDHDTRRTRAA